MQMSPENLRTYELWMDAVELAQDLAHQALEQLGVAKKHEGYCDKTEQSQAGMALVTLEFALQHMNRALQQPLLPI